MWEKDYNNNEPPRLIIPVVFYHGADEWKIPRSFAAQFDVDDEVKRFLLDYRYILFDTNPWDFRDESNNDLKKNVFLFTSMVLMKAAYKHDTEAILEIFKFWYNRGFLENIDIVVYFLEYVSKTQEINRDQLKKMLDESKIDGGEFMPTLAQQMKEEFREEFEEEFKQTLAQQMKEKFREEFLDTMGPQLKNEGKKETAKQMLKKGFDLDTIIDITGLEKTVIEKLSSEL